MENYRLGVEHTDTITGAPDITELTVAANDEDEALELAKKKPAWPEPEYYDEDDVSIKRL